MDCKIKGTLNDIEVLLHFLQSGDDETDNYEAQITSLQTISVMCSEDGVDNLHRVGGIDTIWELYQKTNDPGVCQTCLYTLSCAVEMSNTVKKYLTNKQLFENIKGMLDSAVVLERTKLCSIYFLLTLLSDNVSAQDLMLATGCLQSLLRIYIERIKFLSNSRISAEKQGGDLWLLSCKALKLSLALPQNVQNQRQCAQYIPHIITVLYESKGDENVILQSCQLFSAVVSNNEHCQSIAFKARGVEVFILLLQSWASRRGKTEIVGNIITAVSSLIADKAEYCMRFQKLGGLSIFISLLNSESNPARSLGICHLNQALTILTKCANDSEQCRKLLSRENTAACIVRLMNEIDGDVYFNKVAAHLLGFCLDKPKDETAGASLKSDDSSSESDSDMDEDSESGPQDVLQDKKVGVSETKTDAGMNDSVMEMFQQQQKQINLLQELLLAERNLRLKSEEDHRSLIEKKFANSTPRAPSREASTMTPVCNRKREPDLYSKAGRKGRNDRQLYALDDRFQTPASNGRRKLKRISESERSYSRMPLHDGSSAQRKAVRDRTKTEWNRKKTKNYSRNDTFKVPSQSFSEFKVHSGSKTKFYVQSSKSIRQFSVKDKLTPNTQSAMRKRFLETSTQDQDDIVSICSDILEEEVQKSKKRHHRALFSVPTENRSGRMDVTSRLNKVSDWVTYSYGR